MNPLKLALTLIALGSMIGLHPGRSSVRADDNHSTRVYVTNSKGDEVTVIDPVTMKVVGTIKTGANPHGIVASPDHRTLYISVEGTDELISVDTASVQVKGSAKDGRGPNALSVTADVPQVF